MSAWPEAVWVANEIKKKIVSTIVAYNDGTSGPEPTPVDSEGNPIENPNTGSVWLIISNRI